MNQNDIYTLNFNNCSVQVDIPKDLAGDYSIIKLVKDTRQVDLTAFDCEPNFLKVWNYFMKGNTNISEKNFETVLNFYNIVDYLGIKFADKIYHIIQLSLVFYSKNVGYPFRFLNPNSLRPIDEIEPSEQFLNFAFNDNYSLISKEDQKWVSFRVFNERSYFTTVYISLKEEDYQPGKINECKDVYVLFEYSCAYYHFPSVILNFSTDAQDREIVYAIIDNKSIPLYQAVKYADQIFTGQDFRRKRDTGSYIVMSVANRLPNMIDDPDTDEEDEEGYYYTYYKVAIKYEDYLSKYQLGMSNEEVLTGYFENVIIMKFVMAKNIYNNYEDTNYFYPIPHSVFIDMDKNKYGLAKVYLNHIGVVEDLITDLPRKAMPIFWQVQVSSPWQAKDFELLYLPEPVGIKNHKQKVVF